MEKLWIAIEGGGTRSTLSFVSSDLEETAHVEGPALHGQRITIDTLHRRCHDFIQRALHEQDISGDAIRGLGLALAGADRQDEQDNIRKSMQSHYPEWDIFVTSDVRATHAGAFDNGDGILVIAGTGSIVMGRKDDKWRRAGGYGYRLGDEGSGHAIGSDGLRAVGRDFDGQQQTALTELLRDKLDIGSREELIRWTYDEEHTPSAIAPYVIECARSNDPVCRTIIERHIGQLTKLISSLTDTLHLKQGPLVCHGGLFESSHFKSQFVNRLKKDFPKISVVSSQYNPRVGVCLMMDEFL